MSLALSHPDAVSLYDRLAPRYDRLHRRWLKHAGGEAQVALEAAVRALASPTTNLLDAGCGTGAFARALIAEGVVSERVTLLDPSEEMLARCADIPANRMNGRLEALPFRDGAFDMVTCAWALETVQEPDLAVRELCRVVRPGGVLCVIFCAQAPSRGLTAWLLRQSIIWRGTGQFLSRDAVIDTIREIGGFEARAIPNNGPAAAVLARRAGHPSNQDGS